MIKEETLFIVGAGASKPYGYPTGAEMRKYICQDFVTELYSIKDKINLPLGFPIHDIESFSEVFSKSSTASIDLFLSRNPKYSTIGKLAIAFSIAKYEFESKFREDTPLHDQDWYSFLYSKMTSTLTSPDDYLKLKDNKLAFLTFNYDRSLEHFLFESTVNSFHQKDIVNKLERLEHYLQDFFIFKIKHIYGVISDLRWQNDQGIEYRDTDLIKYLWHKKENIKVISERDEIQKKDFIELLHRAKNIFFLGFSFAEENINILDIPDSISKEHNIFICAYGMTNKEIARVEGLFKKTTNVNVKDDTCINFLREFL